ncbi:MAG: hypothetical protein M3Y87_36785, partial [Myxococcota bacterium]|nr:hypothetical protein [Myxococcota bacterium]
VALDRLGALEGGLESLAPPAGRVVVPDLARHARYAEARERQRALYRREIERADDGADEPAGRGGA